MLVVCVSRRPGGLESIAYILLTEIVLKQMEWDMRIYIYKDEGKKKKKRGDCLMDWFDDE